MWTHLYFLTPSFLASQHASSCQWQEIGILKQSIRTRSVIICQAVSQCDWSQSPVCQLVSSQAWAPGSYRLFMQADLLHCRPGIDITHRQQSQRSLGCLHRCYAWTLLSVVCKAAPLHIKHHLTACVTSVAIDMTVIWYNLHICTVL